MGLQGEKIVVFCQGELRNITLGALLGWPRLESYPLPSNSSLLQKV